LHHYFTIQKYLMYGDGDSNHPLVIGSALFQILITQVHGLTLVGRSVGSSIVAGFLHGSYAGRTGRSSILMDQTTMNKHIMRLEQ